jgi:hypothetical protein
MSTVWLIYLQVLQAMQLNNLKIKEIACYTEI